ncbi:LOW QUALITY PROTEIN: hypothetical protein CRUP_033457 [Coryphaenoides rupestris]|nr:LOW QUALITY PROTEIN: hypothetical protein CRUP_033457 [Coryphaenoides rupestris]
MESCCSSSSSSSSSTSSSSSSTSSSSPAPPAPLLSSPAVLSGGEACPSLPLPSSSSSSFSITPRMSPSMEGPRSMWNDMTDSARFMPPPPRYGEVAAASGNSVSSPKLRSSSSRHRVSAVASAFPLAAPPGGCLRGLDPGEEQWPGDASSASPRCWSTRFTDCERLLLRNVRVRKPGRGEWGYGGGEEEQEEEEVVPGGGGGGSPERLLRKEVSPKASPLRPTCIVWRKSPSGELIISRVRSMRDRRLVWEEPDTSCFRMGMAEVEVEICDEDE